MLIVKKFGGTSIADNEKIMHAAKKCAEEYQKGNDIVVVLSAMGKYTDELIAMAHQITPDPSAREMDMLLATGEQMAVALMSMALDVLGIPAISLNARQAKIHTTSLHGNARITHIETDRIQAELAERKIVLVTGFQGIAENNDYTTLGRGGSNTTALALAAALQADACEMDTDADSIYAAASEKLPTELSGAEILHSRCIEPAKQYAIPLAARSGINRRESTVVQTYALPI